MRSLEARDSSLKTMMQAIFILRTSQELSFSPRLGIKDESWQNIITLKLLFSYPNDDWAGVMLATSLRVKCHDIQWSGKLIHTTY